MEKLSLLWAFVGRHKYMLVIGFFVIYVGIFDDNSILYNRELRHEISNLQEEIDKYQQEYDESTRQLNELEADMNSIERIAREKYLMKKHDEDIFIFEEDLR